MKIFVSNIEWDTDGEVVDLPTELVLENVEFDEDAVGEFLSDEYGFCHTGFSMKILD